MPIAYQPYSTQSFYTVRERLRTLLTNVSKPQLTNLRLLTFGLFAAGNCQLPRLATKLPLPLLLISLKAGGVGLNLTAAGYVIHIDPWWNPAVEMQATDRTHRIGQDKPAFVYKLITRDTVEEKILLLQDRKRALVSQLISTEGGFFKNLTRQDIELLFE